MSYEPEEAAARDQQPQPTPPQQAHAHSPEQLVINRLKSNEFEPLRRKLYDLRRIVAGDLSPITPSPRADPDEPGNGGTSAAGGGGGLSLTEFGDFMVTYYHEGYSNKILQAIKTLLMQTSLNFPEIEFEDLSPDLAVLNAQYCKVRLGESPLGCNARDHMRLALLDYMVGGLGWVKVCVRGGQPVLMNCDTLDMTWDRSVRIPTDIRWASCRYREPVSNWQEMFGPHPFMDLVQGTATAGGALTTEAADHHTPESEQAAVDGDRLLELEWYYDTEGAAGSWYVVRTDNQQVVHQGQNPYYFELNGQRVPFLPYEPIYYMALPSVRTPIGIVEMMLPNQIAVWEAENNIRTSIQRGAPFYQVREGSLEPDEEKRFEDGDIGTLVKVRQNGEFIMASPGIQISPDVLRWRDQQNNELPGQSGANPYTAGAPVQGVSYAAEVNAIQGNAGLVAATIAKDCAGFWQRSTKKFLATAKLYDDNPIRLRVNQVDLYFDPSNPVSQFIVPDAEVVVAENSMDFKSREQKVAAAANELQTAMSLAQLYPRAPHLAYAKYLRAVGEQNIPEWLEQPQAQPMQQAAAGQQEMLGGVISGEQANTQSAG